MRNLCIVSKTYFSFIQKMELLLNFAFALVYLLVLDLVFIGLVLRRFFGPMVSEIQGDELRLRWAPAIVCYVFIAFGLAYFAVGQVKDESPVVGSLQWGFVWGAVVYAIFDLTNLSMFSKYKYSVAGLDILWGGMLGFLVCLSTKYTVMAIKRQNK